MKGYLSKTLKLADQTILIRTDVPQTEQYIVSRSNILECPDTLQHPTVVDFEVGDEKDQDGNLIVLEAKIIGSFELQKLCTKCEVEKPINGWTIESYCNHEMTICRKCSNKKDPPKPKKKKEDSKIKKKKSAKAGKEKVQLPFENSDIKPNDWKDSISKVIIKVTGSNDPKGYWEEKARFRLEDYSISTQAFNENKTFTGYFVNILNRTLSGLARFCLVRRI